MNMNMRRRLCVFALATSWTCIQGSVIISRDATRDTSIIEGLPSRNEGASFQLYLGKDPQPDFGTTRVLMDFDLSGLESSGLLLSASLILPIASRGDGYVSCDSADPEGPGCAVVQAMTTAWGEGTGNTTTEGGATWQHSSFPIEWGTSGGDIKSSIAGRAISEPDGSNEMRVDLDVEAIKFYVESPDVLLGFILHDDDNPGFVVMDSRECAENFNSSVCSQSGAPRLDLEFTTEEVEVPDVTNDPTPSPVATTDSPVASTTTTTTTSTTTSTASPPVTTPTPPLQSGFTIVSRNATRDVGYAEAAPFRSEGAWRQLYFGFDPDPKFNTSRVLVDFDLSGLSSDFLAKACIIMTISDSRGDYIQCTSTSNPGPGCGTAHFVTTEWNEGENTGGGVMEGDPTWLHNSFPSEWTTTGGDFGDVVGQMIPEPDGSMEIHFVLQPDKMRAVLDDSSQFYGFLLRDDDNVGALILESRECLLNMTAPECPTSVVPRLELEYFVPESDVVPTASPALATGEVCGRFGQNMSVSESVSQQSIEGPIEGYMKYLSPRYISRAEMLSVTTALNEYVEQEDGDTLLVMMEYTICYEQPLSIAPLEQIQTYPTEFATFMQLRRERASLEQNLIAQGILVVEDTMTLAVRLDSGNREAAASGGSSSSNTTLIIAVAVGVALVAILVAFLVCRRKTQKSDTVPPSTHFPVTTTPTPISSSSPAPETATVHQLPREGSTIPIAAVLPLSASEALNFKMQGESMIGERDPLGEVHYSTEEA